LDDDAIMGLLDRTATAVAAALAALDDWGPAGTKDGQYRCDIAADNAALAVLGEARVGVLSEESGVHRADAELMIVVDPVDGSTNASRGIPWYATSLCAVDDAGPRGALVVNLASGDRFEAVRGRGARRNGAAIAPSRQTDLAAGIIGLTGHPRHPLGWRQFRALGALALDLCAVASGITDGHVDVCVDLHGPWDYLGGLLVCREAGAHVVDAYGRDLVVLDHDARRTPVAAGTPELLEQLLAGRRTLD
jgi:fructose-1,6-bisphosphatase/inositol monophosphatase family enzyme